MMSIASDTNPELVAGYRLTSLLSRGAGGEVWKAVSAEGAERAVKIVDAQRARTPGGTETPGKSKTPRSNGEPSSSAMPVEQACPALDRVHNIDHPHLVHIDQVEVHGDKWMVVMELAEKSLADVQKERQLHLQRGIPRDDLLEYLAEAAEALDLLNFKYGVPHLDVKPTNILSFFNHAKVADAGIVCSLAGIRGFADESASQLGEPLPGITPRYAAPEAFSGRLSRSSDQYSLAIVYQELLTGTFPFDGQSIWQLAMQHAMANPNLEALPEVDRPVVAKALSKDPLQRYPSCLMFVMALVTGEESPKQIPEEKLTAARIIRVLHGGALFQGETASTTDSIADMSATPAMSWSEFFALTDVAADAQAADHLPPPADLAANEDLPKGYRFIKELSRNSLADVWKIQAPDGTYQVAKMILFRSRNKAAEERAIAELQNMRHPTLAHLQFVNKQQARLLFGMEMIDDSLRKRFEIQRVRGNGGIARGELLDYLLQAAQALDELYESMAIAHLGLNPSNLLLTPAGVKIADFGLWYLLGPALPPLPECNLRYTAPELADHRASRASDQYSLAVIYQEMLTGTRPYSDRLLRGVLGPPDAQGRRAELPPPDLEPVPGPDRAILTRALDPIPERRFETCAAMVRALQATTAENRDESFDSDRRTIVLGNVEVNVGRDFPHPRAVINELFMSTIGKRLIQEKRGLRGLIQPGETLVHRCGATFASGMTRKKLTGFARDYRLKIVRAENGLVVYHMPLPGGTFLGWKKKPTLEIQVRFNRPRVSDTRLVEAELTFTPLNCNPEQAGQALREIAPAVIEKLRMYLVADPEYRGHERVPYVEPLTASLVLVRGETGPAVDAVGKDISLDGMGFVAPVDFPRLQYLLLRFNLGTPPHAAMVPARVVRCQSCGRGWHEIGVRFITSF